MKGPYNDPRMTFYRGWMSPKDTMRVRVFHANYSINIPRSYPQQQLF